MPGVLHILNGFGTWEATKDVVTPAFIQYLGFNKKKIYISVQTVSRKTMLQQHDVREL